MGWYVTPAEARAMADRKPPLSQEHSETSKAAARSVSEPLKLARLESVVLRAITAAASSKYAGLTDAEGMAVTGLAGNTYRPRRRRLWERNLVADSGLRRPTRSGRVAVVWVLA